MSSAPNTEPGQFHDETHQDIDVEPRMSTIDTSGLTEFETSRETNIIWSPGDPTVRIYSSVAAHIRAFRSDDAYLEVKTYPASGENVEAAEFLIRRDLYDPVRGRKKPRVLTEEQREARRETLRRTRSAGKI